MLWLEVIVVLGAIFFGARLGSIGIGYAGGLGVLVLTLGMGLKLGAMPIEVILIIMSVIAAIAAMQVAGGLDYMVSIAEHILRKNPKQITILAPVVTYVMTFLAGTGHTAFATLPVIAEVAKEQGIKPPTSWKDLTKLEYRGKVRVANPTTSGTAYNMITTIRYIFNGDEEKTFDFLKKLDVSIDQYTKSGAAGGKSVAIGEIPIAIGYAHDMVKLKVEGAPVVITIPSEGTGYEVASMSLIKGGKDAVNAKKLYDWVLSKTAQDIIGQWYVIPLSKLATKNPVAFSLEDVKTVKQDLQWDADNKNRLLDRWTKEIGSKR